MKKMYNFKVYNDCGFQVFNFDFEIFTLYNDYSTKEKFKELCEKILIELYKKVIEDYKKNKEEHIDITYSINTEENQNFILKKFVSYGFTVSEKITYMNVDNFNDLEKEKNEKLREIKRKIINIREGKE